MIIIKQGSMEYALSLRLVSYSHRITIEPYVKLYGDSY